MAQPAEAKIREIVDDLIKDDSTLFVIDVVLKGNPGNQRLIVLLDGDEGVSIDKCSEVSRGLATIIEENDLIKDKYILEVSSAGLDHPLQNLRQYRKNIGRSLRVQLKDGTKVSGELLQVSEDQVVLEEKLKKEKKQHPISLKNIEKSMVLVSFK